MNDVRTDIKRALRAADKPDPIIETVKGAAALGGGVLAGRYLGKRLSRYLNKRNLAKDAIGHVKLGDAVLKPDNFARFQSAMKAKRK